jgi:hypothetical protein
VNPSHSGRARLLQFFIAAIVGIVVADLTVPDGDRWTNSLVAAGVAAVTMVALMWLRAKRDGGG